MTVAASRPPLLKKTLAAWSQTGAPAPSRAEPAWLAEHRAASRRALAETGFPKPNHDAWKHMGVDAILKPDWYPAAEDLRIETPAGSPGLEVEGWDRAARLPEPTIRRKRTGPLTHFNALFSERATGVYVRKSVCCLQPLRLMPAPSENALTDGWMTHPRMSLALEPGARLDVIFDCGRLPSTAGLMNAVLDIELQEQTALNLVVIGPASAQALSLLDVAVTQRRDSVFRVFLFETHPRLSRIDLSVSLEGENASTDLFGLAILGEESKAHHHLWVDHRVPRTQSQQVFKSILSGSSRFEYDSLVAIRPEAPHSSSEQLNKNLVLSDNARAYARPQLVIETDEVQCHHGATVGQMSTEELLYLKTRGIDPASASELVLRGFVDDLLKEIPVSAVLTDLQKRAHARLEEITR